jgi:energy-coupling factor transporter ATP-binding protein EcfA2
LGFFLTRARNTRNSGREMALVLMCGQPCSGKSTAAACLIKALEQQHGTPVILIDEPSLNLDRNHSYQGKVWMHRLSYLPSSLHLVSAGFSHIEISRLIDATIQFCCCFSSSS